MRLLTSLIFSFVSITAISQEIQVIGKESTEVGPFLINGVAVDKRDKSRIIGATIYVVDLEVGRITDEQGKFSITLPKGSHLLKVNSVGYEEQIIPIMVQSMGNIRIQLNESLLQLNEVIVTSGDPEANIKSTDIGKEKISAEFIQSLPPFVGEVDVLKSVTLLPGVSSVGEASTGFNVRGGTADQNLILLGGATLYNPSHLFGFFSSFNSDLISNVSVFKGGVPAEYGGRASSVIKIDYKNGNFDKWSGRASIGTISGKVSGSGPIIKDKLALTLGGRSTYSGWILNSVNDPQIKNSDASFYDVNVMLNYRPSKKSNLSYSFYRSFDDFKFASDTSYAWSNQNHVLNFHQGIGERFALQANLAQSEYQFSILDKSNFNSFELESNIMDKSLKVNFLYEKVGNKASIGGQAKIYELRPGELKVNEQTSLDPLVMEDERALELSAYAQHDIDLFDWLSASYGVRYSKYTYQGDKTVNIYEENIPRSEETIIDVVSFGSGETIKSYDGIEPRLALRFSLFKTMSLKLGVNKMNQYINLISNTATITPTDIWKLSDQYIKPQKVIQYSAGLFKNFKNNKWETSIEGYYKDIENVIEYKDGATLLLNPSIETQLLNGEGRSFGVEVNVQKKKGRVNGLLGYTYSRSLRKVVGSYPEETINNGEEYPASYDKPHDLTTALNYNVNRNVSLSTIFTYSTGRPVTYPTGKFTYFDRDFAYYSNRNQNRIPDYHRLDISCTFRFNSKRAVFRGDLVFSVYNLYARKNAFSVYFDDVEGAPPQAYKFSIMGIPFPSVTYSFKF